MTRRQLRLCLRAALVLTAIAACIAVAVWFALAGVGLAVTRWL